MFLQGMQIQFQKSPILDQGIKIRDFWCYIYVFSKNIQDKGVKVCIFEISVSQIRGSTKFFEKKSIDESHELSTMARAPVLKKRKSANVKHLIG